MSQRSVIAGEQAWYRALTSTQWKTLLASNLGWVFDGFEAFALILTVGMAMRQLLNPADLVHLPTYAGAIVAVSLIGCPRPRSHPSRDRRFQYRCWRALVRRRRC